MHLDSGSVLTYLNEAAARRLFRSFMTAGSAQDIGEYTRMLSAWYYADNMGYESQ